MSLSTGSRLGPYEILAAIGAGGMGEVYRARDTRLGREVAVKVLPEIFSDDRDRVRRFQLEARAAGMLNHPNILAVHDLGTEDGHLYLVTELLEGETLATRLEQGALPQRKAIDYAQQVARGLAAAHDKGITHRDLKPSNLFITRDGHVKILDFGLAKVAAPEMENTGDRSDFGSKPGLVLGTVGYMSPEQVKCQPVDARSDIFSFGAVLYEMVSGRRAFEASTKVGTMALIVREDPPPLQTPLGLERLIHRCLEKSPEERFQSARDLGYALQSLSVADSGATNAIALPPPPKRILPWIAAAAALVLLIVGGVYVSRFRRPKGDEHALHLDISPPEGGRFSIGGGAALSPDGRSVAFIATAGEKSGLWVRSLDAGTVRFLSGTEGATAPFWSPDGESLAYFAGNRLWRAALTGGVPSVVCDSGGGMARGAFWGSDGRIVFGGLTGGLLQVPAAGGTRSPLTNLDAVRGETNHYWPQLLPGGRILYWIRSQKPENTGTFVASLSKPEERTRVSDANALYASGRNGTSYLLWLRGSTLVAQSFDLDALKAVGEPQPVADPVGATLGRLNVSEPVADSLLYAPWGSSTQLALLDRTGKRLETLGEPGTYRGFRFSPDGRRIALTFESGNPGDLWIQDVDGAAKSRFTFTATGPVSPVWSPDARTIVFSSGDSFHLFRKASSGAGNEERLLPSPNVQVPSDWSRDGRSVLYFERGSNTPTSIWVLPVAADGSVVPGGAPRPYVRASFSAYWATFSPEESPHWVAYVSDESGRNEIYVQAFPEPHGKFQISTEGGQYPRWGKGDGGARCEIFYLSPGNKVTVVSVKLNSDSVTASPPVELFPLPGIDAGLRIPYDVTADGQRFLVRTSLEQTPIPLHLIVNWPALLKKHAGGP
jgi:eukaryotic-like serine/threonine-protein kinase